MPRLTAARFALANVQTWLPADAPEGCLRALALAQQALDAATDANRRLIDERDTPALDAGVGARRRGTACGPHQLGSLRRRAPDAARRASALAVFRVAQEALSNVAKHARRRSTMRIATDGTHLSLIVSDDGTGFSRSRRTGYGLAMRARCEAFGGSFETATPATGHGTRVTARFAGFAARGAVVARRASLS